jgi:hypothetical protein
MAYDLELADRVRGLIGKMPGLTEKAMFGGLAFLVDGNMSVAVSSKGGLLLRVEPEQTMALAKKPHADPFVMRGKPMQGWLRINVDGVKTDKSLKTWIDLSVAFARSLPPKGRSKVRPRGKKPATNKPASLKKTAAMTKSTGKRR